MKRLPKRYSMSRTATLLLAGLLASGLLSWAGDEVFDAKGFNPNRPYVSPLPFEHIDPLNGNLLLVFTDLLLPGNAGFDLRMQRTYNSKIFTSSTFGTIESDSWAGVGWSFHLGRIRTTQADFPLAVEMPDGSSHKLFFHYVGGSSKYVTRDYWVYDRDVNPPQLRLPNGIVYTFGKVVAFGSGNYYRYPTLIQDTFGNHIDITYGTVTQAPDAFATVTQHIGTQTRQVTFTTQTVGTKTRLRTMTFSGRTWTYGYIDSPTESSTKSLMTSVQGSTTSAPDTTDPKSAASPP